MEELQTYELAELDYMNGMKYKDIAEKYNVSINTVKSWKQRYKWNKDGARTKEKSMHTKTKKVCTQRIAVAEEVESVMDNNELNDKQRLFCLYYVKCFNATKAYMKAYQCSYEIALSVAYRMLENVGVRKQIEELKKTRLNREMLDVNDVFQKYMDIAFADITDYADFGTESFTYTDKQGEEQEAQASYVRLKSSNMVDGTIISEVKMGKDGASVKLNDRMKALQWLTDHMELATEEQRAKIAVLKMRANADTVDEIEDDGFIEALKGSVEEDWSDEDSDV